jgi:putative glycosyltransferase (TIGR04372 family)
MPAVFVLRVIRPLVWVRFGYFTVDRIGHFSFDVEYYLTDRSLDIGDVPAFDIFFFLGSPANTQFARMCKRSIIIFPFVKFLFQANQIIPFGERHQVLPERVATNSRDRSGLLAKVGTRLEFTSKEKKLAKEFLRGIGLLENDKFICLIVRDSAYLDQVYRDRDWSYHNFRDTKIEDYESVALNLVERGYWVFRMGKVVKSRFAVDHQRVVDYANSEYRSDFLDVWLMAHCHFSISTGVGLDSIADIFRRPIVFVNYLPILDLEAWGVHITTPKHLVWESSQRPLTLQEHLEHASVNGNYYKQQGIQINDLQPIEITEAVLEMEARLSKKWVDTPEEVKLQNHFWQQLRNCPQYKEYHGWIHPEARLGAHHLRRSKGWLFREQSIGQ